MFFGRERNLTKKYQRPKTASSLVALLLQENNIGVKEEFLADYANPQFPIELRQELRSALDMYNKLLRSAEQIDKQLDNLLRKTTQPIDLQIILSNNRILRHSLKRQLHRVRFMLKLKQKSVEKEGK